MFSSTVISLNASRPERSGKSLRLAASFSCESFRWSAVHCLLGRKEYVYPTFRKARVSQAETEAEVRPVGVNTPSFVRALLAAVETEGSAWVCSTVRGPDGREVVACFGCWTGFWRGLTAARRA